jgi:hypothetical protein
MTRGIADSIQTALKLWDYIFWAPFFARSRAKKPGFPLQVLGFAHANPVGFPLQSLAPRSDGPRICQRKFAASQDVWTSSNFASALNLHILQELFRASCPESLIGKTRSRVRLPGHAKSRTVPSAPRWLISS